MANRWFTKIFGTRFDRELKRVQPIVDAIHEHEARLKDIGDAELQAQTAKFREAIAERTGAQHTEVERLKKAKHDCPDPEERANLTEQLRKAEQEFVSELQRTLDDLLPEAFATVREAARRLLGSEVVVTGHPMKWDMVPYDVQLIGGIVLHQGKIAEMATGEGKTLVATLPLYLNALAGRGAHLVTVNNYLARRDSQWMGHLFKWLGVTVGCIDDTQPGTPERRSAYQADITYGTNNEFGFDYLRDNMVGSLEQRVQRGHVYAIIDEVDSILIDEARTPLIISGPVGAESDERYAEFNTQVVQLVRKQTAVVNDQIARAEPLLADEKTARDGAVLLYQAQLGMPKSKILRIIHKLLQAHALYEKDVEYVVQDGQVFIVDEFTGRLMHGRRWSDGLHQAVEAKEGVTVREETQTLATITIQNYFRMYEKLAGMTGTAETEETEFFDIYKLEVVVIPTNRPVRRVDKHDLVYKTRREKYNAIIEEVERQHKRGLPVLVGTVNVDVSETLARMLKRSGLKHEVLNAKYHEREAEIVAQAGQPGSITIATNMAGRGTDIKLGPGVKKCQVCGIKAREAPFGQLREVADLSPEQIKELKCNEDPPCGLVIVGTERHEGGEELKAAAQEMIDQAVEHWVDATIAEYDDPGQWDRALIDTEFLQKFLFSIPGVTDPAVIKNRDDLVGAAQAAGRAAFQAKLDYLKDLEARVGATKLAEQALAHVTLSVIDEKWKDHLYDLDQLREGIYYRAWGQKDPLVEYKQEAFEMFKGLIADLRSTFAERRLKLQVEIGPPAPGVGSRGPGRTVTSPAGGLPGGGRRAAPMVASKPAAGGRVGAGEPAPPPASGNPGGGGWKRGGGVEGPG